MSTISPNPTETSAAATSMEKKTKTWPFICPNILAKTTKSKLDALSINSIHMRSMMTFLRTKTPSRPMQKSAEPSHK